MRYCLALDLVNEAEKIAAYEAYHKEVWPEIIDSITSSGIQTMEIYRVENRLFMIMETDASFSFEAKSLSDTSNPKVQEWEKLMWSFQKPLPWAKTGEKWVMMDQIFEL